MMQFFPIGETDFDAFHKLADAYYREGEDAQTPQEEIDSFISFLFDKVVKGEIYGLFTKNGCEYIGFALWAIDTEDFAFCEIPGFGTILEIGIAPPYRASGRGKEFVSYIEQCIQRFGVKHCYVSAYGPAQTFWENCGYAENGKTANNGLPILTKELT